MDRAGIVHARSPPAPSPIGLGSFSSSQALGTLGAFPTTPGPLFSAGLTAAQPQDWENCPKRAEKAGWKLMSSLLADYRPSSLRGQ